MTFFVRFSLSEELFFAEKTEEGVGAIHESPASLGFAKRRGAHCAPVLRVIQRSEESPTASKNRRRFLTAFGMTRHFAVKLYNFTKFLVNPRNINDVKENNFIYKL